jgi:hypothetical protein
VDGTREDAQVAGLPGDAFLAGGRQPAVWYQERLAVWPRGAWFQVVWLRDLPVVRHPHHFQVELEADWQSVARASYWATAKRLA